MCGRAGVRGARIALVSLGALGGSMLGALIGALPGTPLLALSANCAKGCAGYVVGVGLGNIGGFAGLSLAAALATNAVGHKYYGRGTRFGSILG